MTPEERTAKIIETIWFWLPARWFDGVHWLEIVSVEVTGDEESGGATVMARKDDSDPSPVLFTNDELYGGSVLSVEAARLRVGGV